MKFDFIFNNQNPFLALVEGKFQFTGAKTEQKELHIVKSGIISVPSGKLMITDPFFLMHKENNPFIIMPSGNYQTYITVSDSSDSFTGEPEFVKEAYLSIIIDKKAMKERIAIQEKNIFSGINPAVDSKRLAFMNIEQENISKKEDKGSLFVGVSTVSKVIAIADSDNIRDSMPDETEKPWFENFFNYDVTNSWFDTMDNPEHIRCGSANIRLPKTSEMKNNFNNIVLTYCGRDDFAIPAIAELNEENQKIIAIHLDFGVIPVYDKPPVSNTLK